MREFEQILAAQIYDDHTLSHLRSFSEQSRFMTLSSNDPDKCTLTFGVLMKTSLRTGPLRNYCFLRNIIHGDLSENDPLKFISYTLSLKMHYIMSIIFETVWLNIET